MKLKLPSFLQKLAVKFRGAPPRTRALRATASRRAQPSVGDFDDERPTTRLSSAFIVVLLLHLVAVGGIYAFNSIKAHRRAQEVMAGPAPAPAAAAPSKPVLNADAAYAVSATPAPLARPAATPAVANRSATAKATPKPASAADQQRKADFLAAVRASATPRSYVVHTGDNPTSIARKFGVSQSDLLKLNNIDDPKKLPIGQTLKIPPPKVAKTDSAG